MLESVVHKLIDDQTAPRSRMLLGLDKDLTPGQVDELRAWVRDKYGG